VVKKGDQVIMHSATGADFVVPLLKDINLKKAWRSPDAEVAMASVKKHVDNLECYACHATWVPQCYGCHVKVDYSGGKSDTDWVAGGSQRDESGQTAESPLGTHGPKSPGKASESRSYLRWEDPILGINGEGRVTPLMPGCQVVYTVIDREGKTIAHNVIARSPDEAKQIGQSFIPLAIDVAPAQPHSVQTQARSCESCHNNPKALGYGINKNIFQTRYAEDIVEDLIDARRSSPPSTRSRSPPSPTSSGTGRRSSTPRPATRCRPSAPTGRSRARCRRRCGTAWTAWGSAWAATRR